MRVSTLSKTALVLYSQGVEDLIFNVNFTLENLSKAKEKPEAKAIEQKQEAADLNSDGEAAVAVEKPKPPVETTVPEMSEMAWVVPVPTVPTSYRQEEDQCFKELDDLFPVYRYATSGGGFGGSSEKSETRKERSLIVYPPQTVGDYAVTPLRALGKEGIAALKDWLEENNFAPMSEQALKYYAGNNWTFLAIKVKARELKAGVPQALHPLHVTFRSPKIVFPMKMAEGKVSATLFVMTDTPLPTPDKAFQPFGFDFQGARKLFREDAAKKELAHFWRESGLRKSERAYLYRYQAEGITPSKFTTDVCYPFGK